MSDVKVFVEMDRRRERGGDYMESGYRIVDSYKLIIPLDCQKQGYEVLKSVLDALPENTIEKATFGQQLEISCFKAFWDFVDSLEDLYKSKDKLESKIRAAMEDIKIFEYTLIIYLSTLYS